MAKPKPNLNWVGHTIGGRYKIEQFLDQGGMSAVYKASDPNLQRTVALKIIHPHLSSDPEFVRRFEQEAAAVAQLRHPNIIQVYDFNHDQDTFYIVLEYAPGQTLKERLKTLSAANGRLPIPDAIRIMTEISDAVAYAHEKGMIHRDLKPANVMLSPKGQAILMDFGVAKMLDGVDHTATGTIVGTAKYMSPEQARGERPDERSDIYSLGIMLYEMVAGRPPFDADTTVAILMKHVNEPVPDIRQLHADVPNELVEIIDKALAKDRNERYQSAAHMAAALKLINRLGQTTTPATDAQKTVSSKKRQSTEPSSKEPAPASAQAEPELSEAQPAQPAQATNKSIFLLIGAAALVLIFIIGLGGFFIISQLTQPSDDEGEAVAQAVDPNLPSSEGMVKIEGNTYPVGLNNAGNDYASEQQIELAEYWIDQHEVTNAEYAEFLADTGGQPPADWPQGNVPDEQENHPVKGVTWEQATAYCEWAKKRLPTEAEWEVAARGSEGRLYPWGDKQQAVSLPRSGTYAVGSKTTNQSPFGVFDMAGNVWEWVRDPYASIPEGQKVLRGGANDFLKDMVYRLHGDPSVPTMHASAGMRCAASKVNVIERQSIAENVFYQDSFADPGSGWPIQSEGTFYYGYHPPDFFHVEVGTPENFTSISRQPDFEDITVEAEILVDHTNTEDGDFRYGLALRRKSPNQFYAFTVSSRAGMWYVLKSSPSGLETLAEGSVDTLRGFAPQGFTPDETDKVRVDASGSNFIFHINGKAVAQVSDSEYSSGEIGFFVENFDETLAHVHFDTLTIRELEFDAEQVASNVLYKDEFTDPSSGWPFEDEEGAPYRVGYHPPDFYHVEPRAVNETTVVSTGEAYEDVTVEVEVFVDHTETEDGDFRYGLMMRRTAEEQFYAFTISPRSGEWYVLKSSSSGVEVLKEGEINTLQGFAPPGFTPDKTDKLRVDANGSDFTFHINGQVVAEVSDSEYGSGEVGFYVENFDESLSHIHYETLTIRELEIAPEPEASKLYEDEFTDPSSGWPNEDVEGEPFRVGYHPPDFYHVEPRAANETTVVSEGQEFEDVTVKSVVFVDHTETENGDYRYGLVVRRMAEEPFYAFTVSPRSGTWYVLKSSPSGLETLAEGSVDTLRGFAPAGFTPDKRDKLRVDAQGSTLAFHINDEPIVQVSDPDYASGEIGFFVENFDETLTHIHYESLTVQEVEAEAIAQAPTGTPQPSTPTPTAEPVPTATPTPAPPEGMTLIPAGYFQMGSSTGQALERPEHPVFLDAFYIDTYEVTNAQYRECVQDGGCTQISAQSATRQNYRDNPAYDDYPVVNVTWDQANAYCQWAGKHLPSEAQWEYAASGPDNLTWPWGNSFEANRLPANEPDTQPVGSYPEGASPFGVFDMAGNVAEWIADEFAEDFYSNSPPTNPISTEVSAGRIFRGGSFGNTDGQFYTTSRRYGNIRTFSDVDIGFRCAQDAPNVTLPEERAELVAEFCELYDTYNPDALCP